MKLKKIYYLFQKLKKGYKFQINYNFLSSLFNYLSKIENKELFECSEQYYNKTPYHKRYESKIEFYNNSLELYPIINKTPNLIKLGKEGWHSRYYYIYLIQLMVKKLKIFV